MKVFVFTPMVALMYDQVRQLQNRGIPAIALGDDYNSLQLLAAQTPGEPMVVYLTAEYMYGPFGECCARARLLQQLVEEGRVSLIPLDEAHLLFEWEHFRYANPGPLSVSLINVWTCLSVQAKFQTAAKNSSAVPHHSSNGANSDCSSRYAGNAEVYPH